MSGRLIYLLNVSLDGYVEAPDGSLDRTIVDDEIHTWFNEQMRSLDATLYGRRIDEYRLVVHPVVLGGGKPFWPELDAPLRLRQIDSHRFASGAELRSYVPA